MRLTERIEELLRAKVILRPLRLPDKLMVEQCYERINDRSQEIRPINKIDHDTILAKLHGLRDAHELMTLTIREMKLASSCLFEGEKPLGGNHSFLEQYLDALRSLRSRVAIKRLIHSYCLHFDPNHRGIQQIGLFLREAISSVSGRWEWPERHRRYKLFDPALGPKTLAGLTLGSMKPRKELQQAGLTGQLLTGGLAVHVFLWALTAIQGRLETKATAEDVDCAIAWVKGEDGGLLFSAQRAELANALLLPWSERDPPIGLHQKIVSFLLDILNDPRIDGGLWLRTDQVAQDVMIRWLAQATLEQFLKVVDRIATRHQWEYRRAFWNAYIEKRVVANAWVVFGTNGAQVATRIAGDTGDKLMRRFAMLSGGSADQAVLLLSIGDLIVADWSHDGRLRIWRRGNVHAPEFNLKSYAATDLRSDSDFDTVHLPPDGWQGRTEAYIRKYTGVRLIEAEYMPRVRRR
jgi:hypothetical protein